MPLVLLGILISVFGTCFLKSHLLVWSFLVLGSLSVCGWLKPKIPSVSLALYFVVSVLGSLLFLISCSDIWVSPLLLQLSLLLKLGFAPFHFWVFTILSPLKIGPLVFFLGPLKIGILWLLVSVSHPSLLLAFAALLVGVLLLWLTATLHIVVYASGSCQLIILLLMGPSFFPSYFLIYLIALLGIFWFTTQNVSSLFAFLCLGALPPLTMFWAKVLALSVLPILSSFLLLLISLLTLFPYLQCSLGLGWSNTTSPTYGSFLCLLPFFLVSLL